jgi:SprT protein
MSSTAKQGSLTVDQISSLIGLPSSNKRNEVEAIVEKYMAIADRHFGKKFNRPLVTYNLKGTTAGWAMGGKEIRINYDLLNDPRYYDDMVQQTVPHEVAHIVVHQMFSQASPHGAHWQLVMAVFGKPATRCHQYETKPVRKHKKFHYTCMCSGRIHQFGSARHHRAQGGQRSYRCTICNGRLSWNGASS